MRNKLLLISCLLVLVGCGNKAKYYGSVISDINLDGLHLPGGDLTIKAGPEQNLYTTSLKVNGKHRGRAWIDLEEIEKGGTIEYGTASKPGSWGKSELPPSFE